MISASKNIGRQERYKKLKEHFAREYAKLTNQQSQSKHRRSMND
jgi:hypothetical protein